MPKRLRQNIRARPPVFVREAFDEWVKREVLPLLQALRELVNGYFGGTDEIVDSGTDATVDFANFSFRALLLNTNTTLTFTTPEGVGIYILRLVQDSSGSRTVTWPTGDHAVHWPAGVAPTLTVTGDAVDLVIFFFDGTYFNGITTKDFK